MYLYLFQYTYFYAVSEANIIDTYTCSHLNWLKVGIEIKKKIIIIFDGKKNECHSCNIQTFERNNFSCQ